MSHRRMQRSREWHAEKNQTHSYTKMVAATRARLTITEEIFKLGDRRNILELYAGNRDLDAVPEYLTRLPNIEVCSSGGGGGNIK